MRSVDAVQVNATDGDALGTAARFVGTVGGVLSTLHVKVAGWLSAGPFAVASTVKVWLAITQPGVRPRARARLRRAGVELAVLNVARRARRVGT